MITPNGMIRLCATPLALDQKNQIRFASRVDQVSYFASQVLHTFDNVTFTRQDQSVKIPLHIDKLWNINYVMYNNSNFGGRWFYAFVTGMEWMSENSTKLTIKTDVYQSWMLDCEFKRSFVEREHTATDVAGEHIVNEGLQLGEFVQNGTMQAAGLGDMDIVLASTISDEQLTFGGTMINNVYQGCGYYGQHGTTLTGLNTMLANFIGDGKEASIVAIYMSPHLFSNFPDTFSLWSSLQFESTVDLIGPSAPASVDGYTPRNNKLLTYPYSFLYGHNNNGAAAVFKWEFFDGTPVFQIIGSPLPGSNFKMYPTNLLMDESIAADFDQGLTLAGFPLCSWTNDAYKSWLAQNTLQTAIGVAGGMLAVGVGAAIGNGVAVAGGVLSVLSTLASIEAASIQPPQAQGNLNSGGANCATLVNDFFLQAKSIRATQARIIDEFFDMYGYKVNRVKVPELSSRPAWNYVKTIDANITGDIPADNLVELRELFNKGITLWASGTVFADYGQTNTIVEE